MRWLAIAIAVVASVIALLLLAYAPRWWNSRREPTEAEATRLADLCGTIDVDPDRIALVRTTSDGSVDVQLAGLPGRRELLVTEAALEQFDDPDVRALLAAAAERARLNVAVVQALASGVVVGLLASVYVTPLSFGVGMVSMVLFALATSAVTRRLHYAADRRAADRVGAERLADAIERATDRPDATFETGSWRTYFEVEPPTGDRIARLRTLDSTVS